MNRRTALVILVFAASPAALAATYTIDSAHTFPQFQIRHLQFSLIHGQFDRTSGTVMLDRAKGTGSVEVTIAVDSIDTGNGQRNKDLLVPGFFDAAKYPTIGYKSDKVVINGDKATVYGKLTMKGVTRPVTLDVTRIHCAANPFGPGERCGFDAEADIKRSDFGISADSPMIPDDVHLVINAEAVSAAAGGAGQ
jgi:polyisoprenoid-binding protein YceI